MAKTNIGLGCWQTAHVSLYPRYGGRGREVGVALTIHHFKLGANQYTNAATRADYS